MGIDGIAMVSVYCTDLERSLTFYRDVLGFDPQPMGRNAAYCQFGAGTGFYIVGGRPPAAATGGACTTFTLAVTSARETFDHLQSNGVTLRQAEPMDMGDGQCWFEAVDPDGLIIEFLGG